MVHHITPENKSTSVSATAPGIGFQEFLAMINAKGSWPTWQGKCCVHDDQRASMTVTFDQDTGKVLVHCFACTGNLISGMKARGYWPVHPPSQEAVVYAQGKEQKEFSYELVTKTDGKPTEPMAIPGHRHVLTHDYYSYDGEFLGRTLRYDALGEPEPGKKIAKQFRPQFCFKTDTGPKWMYKMPPLRPLYNLPALKTPGRVLVVEGEKTADAAQKIFPELAVISPMGGLQGLSKTDLTPLAGRQLIIWSDADQNWENNVSAWHNVLIDSKCSRISYVRLPSRLVAEHPKWDLADEVPEWFDPRVAIHEITEFLTPDRDPVLAIKCAEDLKKNFVVCTIGQSDVQYIYMPTGFRLSQRAFDALYRNLTSPRDLGLPSTYFLNARDRHISYAAMTYVPKAGQTVIVNGENNYNEYRAPFLVPVKGDVKPFLDHIDWMLNKEDGHELLCRLANMVQNPHRRPLSAFVLKGSQGLGKNLLFDCMIPLVGSENCAVTDPDSVLSNYNYYCAKKVMVIFNEMTDYERHELYDRLKTVITDEMITVRQKYIPEYQIRNFTHIFCMTNHDRPIRLPDEQERRFYIAEAVPLAPKSQDYYDEFVAWRHVSSGALLHYLLNFNLGSWVPEARPKLTEAKRRVVQLSKSIPEQMWEKAKQLFTYKLYSATEFAEMLMAEGATVNRASWKIMDDLLAKSGGGRVKGITPKGDRPTTGGYCKYVTPFEFSKYDKMSPGDITREYYQERNLLDEQGRIHRGHTAF